MIKFIKWLLISVVGLTVLAAVAAVVLVFTLDWNAYRDQIAQVVEEQTGRELHIEGDLGISIIPLGLQLGRAQLANAPGYGDEPFASVEEVRVSVAIMPLFKKQVEVDTILLDGVTLRLAQKGPEQNNWSDLAQRDESTAADAPAKDEGGPGEGAGDGAPDIKLTVAGVSLRDASVEFRDLAQNKTYRVAPVNLQLGRVVLGEPVDVSGDLRFEGTGLPVIDARWVATVTVPTSPGQVKVDGLELNVTASGEAVPGGEQTVTLTGSPRFGMQDGVLVWPDLQLTLANLAMSADLRADTGAGAVQASLQLTKFSPRELMQRLGLDIPATADPDVLKTAAMDAKLSVANGRINLEPINLSLDDTRAKGFVRVLSPDGPVVRAGLDVNGINLDRYLPPGGGEGGDAGQGGGEQAGGTAEDNPLAALRPLDLEADLTLGALTVSGMQMSDAVIKVTAKDGIVRMRPFNFKMYGGRYEGNVRLDVNGAQPRFQFSEQLVDVQAAPLLRDLLGQDPITGRANMTFTGEGVGLSPDAIMRSMVAKVDFRFLDGAVKGVNVARQLRVANARLKGGETPPEEPKETDFAVLGGSLKYNKGVVSNDDLDVKTPLMRITGVGKANVLEQSLDYRLTVNLVASLKGQGGEGLDELRNLPIPLRIQGSFTDPKVSVDLAGAVSAKQKQRLEAETQKIEQKADEEEEKLKDEVDEKAREAEKKLQDRFKNMLNR